MEVKTGNVKVIVNLSKDSNNIVRESYNYAIGSHVAPGSTFKLASILALIDDGKIDINDQVDLEKGTYQFSNLIMKDSPIIIIKLVSKRHLKFHQILESQN